MNKNTLKVFSLVVGILVCTIALFDLISSLISLVKFVDAINRVNDGKYIAYWSILFLISLASIVLNAIVGAYIIKAYVSKTDEAKYMELPAIIYFGVAALASLLAMIFYGAGNATAWILLILGTAGLVLLLLNRYSKYDVNTKNILRLVAMGIGFVLSIVVLTGSDGINVVTNLCAVALFVILFLYYLFKMLMKEEAPQLAESAE